MRFRILALIALLAVSALSIVGLRTGWKAPVVVVREIHQEIEVAWVWFGIPSGVVGALVGGLRRRQTHPASAAFSAVLGALIATGLTGILVLAPYLGLGILVVAITVSLSIAGATVGWTAGGDGSNPTVALLGAVAGTLAFVRAVPMLGGVADLGTPYALAIGLVVGGLVWMIRFLAGTRTST